MPVVPSQKRKKSSSASSGEILRHSLDRPGLRRIFRRAGVKRISGLVYEPSRKIASSVLKSIIEKAIIYADHARRKTVMSTDVSQSLKLHDITLYGSQGTNDSLASLHRASASKKRTKSKTTGHGNKKVSPAAHPSHSVISPVRVRVIVPHRPPHPPRSPQPPPLLTADSPPLTYIPTAYQIPFTTRRKLHPKITKAKKSQPTQGSATAQRSPKPSFRATSFNHSAPARPVLKRSNPEVIVIDDDDDSGQPLPPSMPKKKQKKGKEEAASALGSRRLSRKDASRIEREVNDILKSKKPVGVLDHDSYESLVNPNMWLDDSIVSAYMKLICKKVFSKFINTQTDASVAPPISFIDPLNLALFEQGNIRKFKLWGEKEHKLINGDKRTLSSIILAPINKNNNHWLLAIVDTERGTIKFQDSLPDKAGTYEKYAESIEGYLTRWVGKKIELKLQNKIETPMEQDDGVSCGVFTCLFARNQVLPRKYHINLSANAEYLRKCRIVIAYELYKWKLLDGSEAAGCLPSILRSSM